MIGNKYQLDCKCYAFVNVKGWGCRIAGDSDRSILKQYFLTYF